MCSLLYSLLRSSSCWCHFFVVGVIGLLFQPHQKWIYYFVRQYPIVDSILVNVYCTRWSLLYSKGTQFRAHWLTVRYDCHFLCSTAFCWLPTDVHIPVDVYWLWRILTPNVMATIETRLLALITLYVLRIRQRLYIHVRILPFLCNVAW